MPVICIDSPMATRMQNYKYGIDFANGTHVGPRPGWCLRHMVSEHGCRASTWPRYYTAWTHILAIKPAEVAAVNVTPVSGDWLARRAVSSTKEVRLMRGLELQIALIVPQVIQERVGGEKIICATARWLDWAREESAAGVVHIMI